MDSTASQSRSWQADPDAIRFWEQDKPTNWNFREENIAPYQLPDAQLASDGTRVTSPQQWEQKRRPETLELFSKYMFGRSPAMPAGIRFELIAEDRQALDGAATYRRIRIVVPLRDTGVSAVSRQHAFQFEVPVFIPNQRSGKVPAFVVISHRGARDADPTRENRTEFWPVETIIARGYATAVMQAPSIQPNAKHDPLTTGVISAMPVQCDVNEAWRTIAAWSWATSRVMDYLQTDPDIDTDKVAVIGHSRGGKTALWTGAQDTRFSLIISNNSGCGGAALNRRNFGEHLAGMNNSFPHWFCENFKTFNRREHDLPFDQHQLMSLIAPRALCVGSADRDLWADPRGEFLSLIEASKVYALYGNETLNAADMPPIDQPLTRGKLGYHIRAGGHGLKIVDWNRYMDFADQLWSKR